MSYIYQDEHKIYTNNIYPYGNASVTNRDGAYYVELDTADYSGITIEYEDIEFCIKSFQICSSTDLNLNVYDVDGWGWYLFIPASPDYQTITFKPENLSIRYYQPNHSDEPLPDTPALIKDDNFSIQPDELSSNQEWFMIKNIAIALS